MILLGMLHKLYFLHDADCRYLRDKVNPLPDDKILDWSKLKEIADDI